jgi:hydrogenase maturation protease
MDAVKPVLILAYGNPGRGDDALGPLLLENLQKFPADILHNVECLTDFQLQIEHALDLKDRALVLFADARMNIDKPFFFNRLQAAYDNSYTTHAMNPAAIMQVYQEIEKATPPPCFLLGIHGVEFDLGASLSDSATLGLRFATAFVRELLKQPELEVWHEFTDKFG